MQTKAGINVCSSAMGVCIPVVCTGRADEVSIVLHNNEGACVLGRGHPSCLCHVPIVSAHMHMGTSNATPRDLCRQCKLLRYIKVYLPVQE